MGEVALTIVQFFSMTYQPVQCEAHFVATLSANLFGADLLALLPEELSRHGTNLFEPSPNRIFCYVGCNACR